MGRKSSDNAILGFNKYFEFVHNWFNGLLQLVKKIKLYFKIRKGIFIAIQEKKKKKMNPQRNWNIIKKSTKNYREKKKKETLNQAKKRRKFI